MKPAASFGTEPEDVARTRAEDLTRKILEATKAEEAALFALPNTEEEEEADDPIEEPPVAPIRAPSPAKRESAKGRRGCMAHLFATHFLK